MHALTRLFAVGLCTAAAASAVHAQRLGATPKNARTTPSANAQAARAAPQPGGLQPIFPAGISSGSGAAVSRDPIARSTSPIPPGGMNTGTNTGVDTGGTGRNNGNAGNNGDTGSTGGTDNTGNGGAPDRGNTAGNGVNDGIGTPVNNVATNVMGAAGATVRGPAQDLAGAAGFSAHDQARSFFFADANKDGELTRAEASRLSIATLPFEEMDRNFDGVITRFEYQDTLR